jgi:UDP-N-acetylmuramoyl-tripeptide--D-alanyl-D-alanine ligase
MTKITINTKEILAIPGFKLIKGSSDTSFDKVVIDSRLVEEGYLFIAIKGENFDGHNFIEDVDKKGAKGIIISESECEKATNFSGTVISYSDTILALGEIAKLWRSKIKAKIIGITGSNGKTTTKEFLSTILAEKYCVHKTEYNNNNHIGVPLTILAVDNSIDYLVLELGTNHFGEIEYTSKIAQPNYALITLIGDSHLEFLIDRNGVLKEKFALFEKTLQNNGKIFVNNDDILLNEKCKDIENKVTYGFDNNCDIKGEILGVDEYGRTKLRIINKNKQIEFTLPIYGTTAAKNILASVAVAFALGLSEEEINNGISKLGSVKGRLNLIEINSTIIIDDTYNANPESMKSAIELVNSIIVKKNKIAILGDMFELGDYTKQKHIELANMLANSDINNILLIGEATKFTNEELLKLGFKSEHFENRDLLTNRLLEINVKDSLILVKGSRGMKMEQFIPIITERAN